MTSTYSTPLSNSRQPDSGAVIVYHAGQSDIAIQLDAEHRTIWATQKQIAQLLDLDTSTVNRHIKNFKDQRGGSSKGIANFAITADDGKTYTVEHYDLTVVTFVGFRAQATDRTIQFQDWVGDVLNRTLAAKQLTPAEMLLASAQQLVDHERRLADTEARLDAIEIAQLALSGGENYFTIKGFYHVKHLGAIDHTAAQRIGKRASKLSRERGVSIGRAYDPLYGEINSYAESILTELIGGVL